MVEVKLAGESLIAEGEATLSALAKKIDVTRMKKPAFRMVVVAKGDAEPTVGFRTATSRR